MSSDPLARSDIWPDVPKEAEYDAVYAAVTATERGRWFLTEYASRNRHTDTHLLLAAIARIETAIHNDSGGSPTAAAIDRIAALTASHTPLPSDISAAVERIQDIAFGLRERAVDAAVCDALDAALREISVANGNVAGAGGGSGGERAHIAGELPHEIAGRVDDSNVDSMIKVAPVEQVAHEVTSEVWSQFESQFESQSESHVLTDVAALPSQVLMNESIATAPTSLTQDEGGPGGAIDEELLSRAGLFDTELQENKNFYQAVAVLAVSLTPLPDETGAAALPHTAPSQIGIPPLEYVQAAEPPATESAEPKRRWHIESPDFAFQTANSEPDEVAIGSSGESGPAQASQLEASLPDPQDDPADLFETPSSASPVEPLAEVSPAPPQNGGGQIVRIVPRPAITDPLAGVRALSEEEKIALFG
jgi:hypothetical protein